MGFVNPNNPMWCKDTHNLPLHAKTAIILTISEYTKLHNGQTLYMKIYQVSTSPLSGTKYSEVNKHASNIYSKIKKKTKRRPYIRSSYFNKGKIFLPLFWNHLYEKINHRDKTRRLKYFPCAIELIENSKFDPESKENVNKQSEILHRFAGKTKDGQLFFVQIKEEKKTGEKWLISVFPVDK